jgi:Domain of unknown function (DUF222)
VDIVEVPDVEQLDMGRCIIDHSYLHPDELYLADVQWTRHRPHGGTATLLEDTPVPATGAGDYERLERIAAWEKVIAWAQAEQCSEITGFVDDAEATPGVGMDPVQAYESARAEVGLVLTLAPGATAWRVEDAHRLVHDVPAAFAALRSGAITLAKARIIAEGCTDLDPDATATVEQRVLPRAPRQTNSQLRAAVARAVARADTGAAERRRERKKRERGVRLYPERDGLATLSATLPAAEAVGVYAVLDQHARACGSADGRTMDARRADTLTDLVLDGTGFASTGTTETAAADTGAANQSNAADGSGPTADDAATADTATSDVETSDVETSDVETSDVETSDVETSDVGTGDAATGDGVTGDGVTGDNPTGDGVPQTTPTADGAASAAGDSAGPASAATDAPMTLPIAPAPSRLPGIAPAGGCRTARTTVSVQIRVTVPLDTLQGHNDEPAELIGYGPITARQARELAADPDSVWRRLVTDPLSGALLDAGTSRYRPPPSMTEHVVARHQYCQFPGCRVPAHRCDLDHNVPHDPRNGTGPTSTANLGPKCRPHHRLKGMRGWSVIQYEDGSILWITPSGHTYLVEPPPAAEIRAPLRPETDGEPAPF